jgi:hypothetical protein
MAYEQIDDILFASYGVHEAKHADTYVDHFLEQYRIYLHIFDATSDRRAKSNEFFLGLNTAIIGIMGYVETKGLPEAPVVFTLIPLAGIAICLCWHTIISSFHQLNQAKFKVIHALEKKLPASLFEAEWNLLGKGKVLSKYRPFFHTEKHIPLIFIVVYAIIFLVNLPF